MKKTKRLSKSYDKDLCTKCKLCGRVFNHLGSHLFHKHGITAREYKEEYGLPYNMALTSLTVKEKKRDAFNNDREKYLKNLLEYGKDNRFKKGHSEKRRVSTYEMQKMINRINKVNKNAKMELCPVCNKQYKSLSSHLYNKHGLMRVSDFD